MPILAKGGGGGDYTPAPEGVHRAVCVDVIDKGLVQSTFSNEDGTPKMQHKVTVAWQIDELDSANGKRFLAFKRYTLSINEKATLRKDLESWRGKAFTRDDEMRGFDIEKVIGVSCIINIQHAKKTDKTYANVVSVMPLMKGMAKLAPLDYVREVDRPKDAPQNGSSDGPADDDDFVPAAAEIFDEDPVPF